MDKTIEQILEEWAMESYQEEYRLAEMADTNGSIGAYITAYDISNDVFMKNYYFQRAVEVARQNSTRNNYSVGYLFCKDIGREEMAEELLTEMWERYPIFTALQILPLKIAGLFGRR